MSAPVHRRPPPRTALSIEEACASLGVSWDLWREHIAPHVRVTYVGRRKLVAVAELERWLDREGVLPGRSERSEA
jgi:hypothetical protein